MPSTVAMDISVLKKLTRTVSARLSFPFPSGQQLSQRPSEREKGSANGRTSKSRTQEEEKSPKKFKFAYMTQYIADEAHFKEVIARVPNVKRSLWIGTADIKDLYVGERPFLSILADLISKGREVRLIHAKEPGPNFREDFDRYPVLFTGLERALCPRVHFKMIILDCKVAYFGSANLTGAGIGMKGSTTRNFEAGILTDEATLVEAAMNQFDSVWAGFRCKDCRRKQYCGDPIMK